MLTPPKVSLREKLLLRFSPFRKRKLKDMTKIYKFHDENGNCIVIDNSFDTVIRLYFENKKV